MSHPNIDFTTLNTEEVLSVVSNHLKQSRTKINSLLEQKHFNWGNLAAPLETLDNQLNNYWSIISHLNSVQNNDDLREAYNLCLPELSKYGTEIGQNQDLCQAFHAIADAPAFHSLSTAQQKTIKNALRDFKLAGIDLSKEKQERYKAINLELSALTSKFSENVLDCTNAWKLNLPDDSMLQGLPESTLTLAKNTAKENQEEGYTLTLDFPCYFAIMQHAENQDLRKTMYQANTTRAASTGDHDIKYDNSPLMLDILRLRAEKAKLLGFDTYTSLSLQTKMAQTPDEVFDFLRDLAKRSLPQAQQELADLNAFAKTHYDIDTLAPWDLTYYAEKQKQALYDFSSEALRPWFPIDKALSGLFSLTQTLYQVNIIEIEAKNTWHDAVRFFEIKDADQNPQAYFYLDLYARKNKRGGAWMDVCREQLVLNEEKQIPIAYLTCNFTPPVDEKPGLLTHDELTTLFHEFGHGLHHMLSKIDIPSVGGISGVPWDAVELPSQFMENFCWQPEVLPMISGHYETGEPLPKDKLDALLAAKNFQSAMAMVRQIEFSLFDFTIHHHFEETPNFVEDSLAQIRQEVSILTPPEWSRFANSFSHIFAGGYAAGYYSYKWAEVLSADAFSAFEENGVLDPTTGRKFLEHILQKGGSAEAMDLFVAFRSRKPNNEALLRHSGIQAH